MDKKIIAVAHQLHELARIDRLGGLDTFFGRMELFESELGLRHQALGLEWRRPGRYGNIIEWKPLCETIAFCLEQGWSHEWLQELIDWYKSQETPDTALLYVIMGVELLRAKNAAKRLDNPSSSDSVGAGKETQTTQAGA